MGCFVVTRFVLTSASRGPSAIAELLVSDTKVHCNIRTGSLPMGAINAGGVGKNLPLSMKNVL